MDDRLSKFNKKFSLKSKKVPKNTEKKTKKNVSNLDPMQLQRKHQVKPSHDDKHVKMILV